MLFEICTLTILNIWRYKENIITNLNNVNSK